MFQGADAQIEAVACRDDRGGSVLDVVGQGIGGEGNAVAIDPSGSKVVERAGFDPRFPAVDQPPVDDGVAGLQGQLIALDRAGSPVV